MPGLRNPRRTGVPAWASAASMRLDPARKAELSRTRADRIAEALGRATPFDLDVPWLTLTPDRPVVKSKGWLEYRNPTFIGMGRFEEGERMFAGFELIFAKEEPSSSEWARPQLTVRLVNPPAAKMLIEIDVHTHDNPPGDPRFEIWAANNQTITMTMPDEKRSEIATVAHDFVAVQSAWADKGEFSTGTAAGGSSKPGSHPCPKGCWGRTTRTGLDHLAFIRLGSGCSMSASSCSFHIASTAGCGIGPSPSSSPSAT